VREEYLIATRISTQLIYRLTDFWSD